MTTRRRQPRRAPAASSARLTLAAACGLAAPAAPAAAQLTEPFPAVFDLRSLDPGGGGDGSLGFVVGDHSARGGTSAAGAGDVNGDGIDDVIIAGGEHPGPHLSWVVFGGGAIPAQVDPLSLDGTDGFRLLSYGRALAVASAGDVNGDGVADIIVGTPRNPGAYIVFGRAGGGFPAEIDLDALDGSDGFRMVAEWPVPAPIPLSFGTGWAVASAGDVNGDGVDDILIGVASDAAFFYPGGGYIVFGRREPFPPSVSLARLGETGTGVIIERAPQRLGAAVASAGDINGDGIDDIVVGAPGQYHEYSWYYPGYYYGCGCTDPGAAYVIFGSETLPASIDVSRLNGADGFELLGFDEAMAGASVAGAGDFNADGLDDVVIGAPGGFGRVSETFIVFGRDTRAGPGFPASIPLSTFGADHGVCLRGELGSAAGASVAGAGDVNGDGIDDVIVAAPYNLGGGLRAGSYVVFGGRSLPASVNLAELDGEAGFLLISAAGGHPIKDNGSGVASAGDVNADGVGDIILATRNQAAYVVYGRNAPCYADCDGSGDLDFFDFLCFQNQFAAGDPLADCDESGELDFFDFLCFQNAFAAGCP